MKKLLKKIKAKHLARFGLVVIVMCYVLSIVCFATSSITINYSNSDNIELPSVVDHYQVNIGSNEGFVAIDIGDSISIVPMDEVFFVEQGVLYFDEEELFVFDKSDISDGYYRLIFNYAVFALYDSSSSEHIFVYPRSLSSLLSSAIALSEDGAVSGLNLFCWVVDSIPTEFDLEVVSLDISDVPDETFQFLCWVLVPYIPQPTVSENLTDVWTDILGWVVDSINSAVGIFWTGSQLTLIGTLALVGTAIALCLLIYNKVKDFIKLQ